MKEDVLAAVQTRRPTGDHYTFIKTRSRLRNRSSSQIEIDIVGDEEIEFAVANVVDKRAAGVPALAVPAHARIISYIRARAITIVVIKNVVAKLTHNDVIEAVIVVITIADTF